MGGPVERSGPFCFELPTGHKQLEKKSNLVPLGQIRQGSFQHRALLFKVPPPHTTCCMYYSTIQILCDNLGLPCSLVRGEYSRHWNEVSLQAPSPSSPSESSPAHKKFVVDLMFSPGTLMPTTSSQAVQYQHII